MTDTPTFPLYELQTAARCAVEHDLMFRRRLAHPVFAFSGDRFSRLARVALRAFYKDIADDEAGEASFPRNATGAPKELLTEAERAIFGTTAAAAEQYRALAALRAYFALFASRELRPLAVDLPARIPLDVEGVGRVEVETRVDMIARDAEELLWGVAFRGSSDDVSSPSSTFWAHQHVDGSFSDTLLAAQSLGYQFDRVAIIAIGKPRHSPLGATKTRALAETMDEFASRVMREMVERKDEFFGEQVMMAKDVDVERRLTDLCEMAANVCNRTFIALSPWRNAESCRRLGGCQYLSYCGGLLPIEALVPRRFVEDEA